MVRTILKYNIAKNGVLLILAFSLLLGYKCFIWNRNQSDKATMQYLNNMIDETDSQTLAEQETYENTYFETYLAGIEDRVFYEGDTYYDAMHRLQAYQDYYDVVSNRRNFSELIQNAKTGEGITKGSTIPNNYLKELNYYKELAPPTILNNYYWSQFFAMQDANILFVWIGLLVCLLFSVMYENDMDKAILTTANGKRYLSSLWKCAIGFVMGITLLNFVLDVGMSGILTHGNWVNASIQSLRLFSESSYSMNLLALVGVLLLWNLTNSFICFALCYIIAYKVRDFQKCIAGIVCLGLVSYLIQNSFQTLSKYFLIGVVNVTKVLSSWSYVMNGRWMEMGLSIGINLIVAVGVCLVMWNRNRRKRY